MKYCFLLTQDLTSPSGLGRYLPWAKELKHLGHNVTIIALHADFNSLSTRQMIISGIPVYYVAQMHVSKTGNHKSYFSFFRLLIVTINATLKLFKAALNQDMEAIVVGKPHPMNGIPGILLKKIRQELLFIVDCDDFEARSNRFQNNLQKKIVALFENLVPRKADIVTTNTYFMLNRLAELGIPKTKLLYLPNGIDRSRFSKINSQEIEELRTRLGVQGKYVVSYIGSLSLPSHPIDILINAFAIVKKHVPEATLLLVGGGEDFGYLQDLAKKMSIFQYIIFVGRVAPDEVPMYYSISNMLVEPVYDNDAARGRCPLKMFESWASGVPFITSPVGDRSILAGDPPAAMLITAGNSEELANGIITLIKNSDISSSLKQRGLDRISEYYWSTIIQKNKEIFLLNSPLFSQSHKNHKL